MHSLPLPDLLIGLADVSDFSRDPKFQAMLEHSKRRKKNSPTMWLGLGRIVERNTHDDVFVVAACYC
jgi:hypothetical protein